MELSVQRVTSVLEAEGISGADPRQVASCGYRAVETAIREAKGGSLVEPDYALVAMEAFRCLGLSVSAEQSRALIDAAYVSGPAGGKVASKDARRTLDTLRARGFLLATVTNRAFGGERFRADLRAAGLDVNWDLQAVSVEVGFMKPHPAIFRYALSALDLQPSEVLMVGNSLRDDIAGAQQLGIRAAWIESPPDAEGVVPDFTVRSLSELLAVPPLEAC